MLKYQGADKKLSFEVDNRVTLRVDFELAILLGKLVLDSNPQNKALLALGHKLVNLENQVIYDDAEDEGTEVAAEG